jgi:hypothetical protein
LVQAEKNYGAGTPVKNSFEKGNPMAGLVP